MKITNSFLVVSNYNCNLDWLREYSDNYIIYNRGEKIDDTKAIQVENIGYNIHDYLSFIIENYEKLPDVVQFTKGNILERHITKEEFDEVCNNKTFTPLLTKNHETQSGISFYNENGIYEEKNTSWYLYSYDAKYYFSYAEFAKDFDIKYKDYLPFAPGACYIVPKDNILKHSKDYYSRLRDLVSWTQLPAEAHLIERTLYTLWK